MPSSAPPRRRGIAIATAATLLATSACTVANSEAGDAGAGGDTLRIVLAAGVVTAPCTTPTRN